MTWNCGKKAKCRVIHKLLHPQWNPPEFVPRTFLTPSFQLPQIHGFWKIFLFYIYKNIDCYLTEKIVNAFKIATDITLSKIVEICPSNFIDSIISECTKCIIKIVIKFVERLLGATCSTQYCLLPEVQKLSSYLPYRWRNYILTAYQLVQGHTTATWKKKQDLSTNSYYFLF